jgi:hypothetical protein
LGVVVVATTGFRFAAIKKPGCSEASGLMNPQVVETGTVRRSKPRWSSMSALSEIREGRQPRAAQELKRIL